MNVPWVAGRTIDRASGREARRLYARIEDLERAARDSVETGNASTSDASHRAEYSDVAPAERNALTLFANEWSSAVPGGIGPGPAPLFADDRIVWMGQILGGLDGLSVLELGPLEGGHSYMLERLGARVEAIEGNVDAFLRCLIVKNYLSLQTRFILGDFAKSFGEGSAWDLVVASGVLYHMTEPTVLLERIAAVSDRILLWTHYFEPNLDLWDGGVRQLVGTKWRPDLTRTVQSAGTSVRIVPQSYGDSLGWAGFCGGPDTHSNWMYRDDLMELLGNLGFTRIDVAFDAPNHQNGPAFCLLAQR
jgi:hypothetical protein